MEKTSPTDNKTAQELLNELVNDISEIAQLIETHSDLYKDLLSMLDSFVETAKIGGKK